MYILGVSYGYHNSAAALLKNATPICACEEERFTRCKNDSRYPRKAIDACLREACISASKVDAVVFYEDTLLKLNRILESVGQSPNASEYLNQSLAIWKNGEKFTPFTRLKQHLGVSASQIHICEHHASHAGAAFYCSPFEHSVILTLDGVGEYETMTVSHGVGNSIKKLYSTSLPHSIGLLYSAFTAHLGFEVNEGEFKVMGMAGFGEPRFADKVLKLIKNHTDGTFSLDESYFDFVGNGMYPFTEKFRDLFGESRQPDEPFFLQDTASPKIRERNQLHADIAASIQLVVEDLILDLANHALRHCNEKYLCLAGGVALNSAANGKLQKQLGKNMYVHPAAGDSGAALGAALYHAHQTLKMERKDPLVSVYLGVEFSSADVDLALTRAGGIPYKRFDESEEFLDEVARILAEGNVVGWANGRFEWGPRALGARSILADPTKNTMQEKVNRIIKYREPFRPFAPACIAEEAHRFFHLSEGLNPASPQDFMLAVVDVREECKSLLPAITHVDGTARVQFVRKETNPLFYSLIKKFEAFSGVPIILNTSFNLRGEPIVNTPYDALRTFFWSQLDALAMNNLIITKESFVCEF